MKPTTGSSWVQLSGPGVLSNADPQPWPDGAPHPFSTAEPLRYEHRGLIAVGAMGRVDRVFDHRLLREVALKTPRTPTAAARLAQEAWITAQLDHPGIVAVHDAGTTTTGLPFYSMRLIRGRTLEEALAASDGRLALLRHFLTACEAVAHAHGLGVVHRDLKPQNIMVGDLGETLVVDWGLARPAASAAGDAWTEGLLPPGLGTETVAGAVVGTPAYMSPEQSLGLPPLPASDVWSLGAILVRLVSGAPPFGVGDPADILRRLRSEPPPPLARVAPDAPLELCAIAAKALAPDPQRRYPTARELAADIESFMEGRRVSAHAYRPAELLRRLARAWRAPLLVGALALTLLAAVGAVAVRQTAEERDRAVRAEQRTSEALRVADEHLAETLVAHAEREATHGQRPEAELAAAEALLKREDPAARGVLMGFAGPGPVAARVLPAPPCERIALHPAATHALCLDETPALWRLLPLERLWTAGVVGRSGGFVTGDTVAIGDWQGRVHLLGLDGEPLAPPPAYEKAETMVTGHGIALVLWGDVVALAGTGRDHEVVCDAPHTSVGGTTAPGRFAVSCSDGSVVLGSAGDPRIHRLPHAVPPESLGHALVLLPGERLAMLHDKGRLTVLSLLDGSTVLSTDTGLRGATALLASADGGLLAGLSTHGGVRILDAESGRELHRLPAAHARAAAWTSDGLVTAGESTVVRWSLPEAPLAWRLGEGAGVATITATGDRVFVGRGDGHLEAWRTDGAPLWQVRLGEQVVKRLAVSPDGARLYVASMSQRGVGVLDGATGAERGRLGDGVNRRLGVLADGTVIVASWSTPPEVFDGAGTPLPGPAAGRTLDLGVDPAGERVALLEERTGRALWWPGDVSIGTWPGATAIAAGASSAAVSAGGRVIVANGGAERIHPAGGSVTDLAFTADGHLVVALLDGSVRVASPDGATLATLRGHTERVAQVVVLPDTLLTGSWDGTVRRWGLGPLLAEPSTLFAEVEARWGTGGPSPD